MGHRLLFRVVLLGAVAASLAYSGYCEETSPSKVIRFAYSTKLFREVDKKDAQAALQVWTQDVTTRVRKGDTAEVKVYDDETMLARDIKAKVVDLVALPPLDYLNLDLDEKSLLEPTLIGASAGKFPEELVLLVHRDSHIAKMDQLKGKRIALESGGKGELARMWTDTLLMREGLPRGSEFFKNIQEAEKESRAVFPVFFQQMDVCVVRSIAYDTMAELNPQIQERLQVLARSPGLGFALLCLGKHVEPELKKDIVKIALTMDQDARGKQLLTFLRQEKVVVFKPEYLESLIALRKEYHDLLARTEGKK
jgi:ABC-type phosphate/phosphonate transport system substrate-binding protein